MAANIAGNGGFCPLRTERPDNSGMQLPCASAAKVGDLGANPTRQEPWSKKAVATQHCPERRPRWARRPRLCKQASLMVCVCVIN